MERFNNNLLKTLLVSKTNRFRNYDGKLYCEIRTRTRGREEEIQVHMYKSASRRDDRRRRKQRVLFGGGRKEQNR